MDGTAITQGGSERRGRTAFFAATVVVDQLTKDGAFVLAAGNTPVNHRVPVVPVENSEFALGLASASLAFTTLLAALGIVAFGVYSSRTRAPGPPLAAGLVLGGATSNLADRLVFGAVRDFLVTPWCVLNLADLAVVAGLGLLVLDRARRTETT